MSFSARRLAADRHTLSQELSALGTPGTASAGPAVVRIVGPAGAMRALRSYTDAARCFFVARGEHALLAGTEEQLRLVAHHVAGAEPDLAGVLNAALQISPPSLLTARDRSLPLGERTLIMGVLNLSPDSFSGDGVADVTAAVERAVTQLSEGADILDVGAMSTRPGSEPVSEDEEAEKLFALLSAVRQHTDAVISADTYRPLPARAALEAGADILNDITGARDARLAALAAEFGAGFVAMHMRGMPATMQLNPVYADLMSEVYASLHDGVSTALAAGVAPTGIVVDPGIGFGKTLEHNLELLRRLKELRGLGCPVLLGPSRKGFIGRLTGRDVGERAFGTAAAVAVGIANGADIVRVHDVAEMRDVVRVADAAVRGGAARTPVTEPSP